MRILITVHDSISPITGGGAIRTIKIAEELKKRGHNVIFLAPSEKREIAGIRVIFLPNVSKKKLLLSTIWFNIVLFFNLLILVLKFNFDMVFSHNIVSGFLCFVFCKILGKRFIFDITDIHSEYLKYSKTGRKLGVLISIFNFIEYFTAKHSFKVIAVTNVMKNFLIEKGVPEKKIRVIYDGVEISDYTTEKETDVPNIIHIGDVERAEGIETIIRAVPLVLKEKEDIKFYFIGDGADYEEMKELSKVLNVDKNCIFTGKVEYSKVKDYFKKAHISIIGRPATPPNNTVITLKLLESWASGTACISTRLKGIEEVATEGKDILFFNFNSSEDLKDKIVYLSRNSIILKKMQFSGRSKVENFSWKGFINQLCDIIENKGK